MTQLRKRFLPASFIICLFALLWLNGPVQAHGYLIRSIPEDRSTLERAPTRLQYWFSEDLEPAFSTINLRDQNGNILASGEVDEDNRSLLRLQIPPGSLPDGAYIVELRPAFASDAHVVSESRVFFVGEEVGAVQGLNATSEARAFEVVWKAILLCGSSLLFGVYMLYAQILRPAWGNSQYPAGKLPPRVMRRLNQTAWAAIALVLLANLLALLQQSMAFFNVDALTVISGSLWQVVRIGSRFGDVWNARMFFLILLILMQIASQYYSRSAPRSVQAFWAANVWLAALIIGAQAVNSHASGSLIWPWVAVAVHWLHSLSVAFWVGGIAALTLILPVALAPYEGETRRQALLSVMRRFSRWVAVALLLVITTGFYSASNWFFSTEDLASNYGTALGLKLLMVGLLIGVGALHHLALRPHLLQAVQAGLKPLLGRAASFGTTMRLEVVMVVVTLGLASLLSATPLPEPAFLDDMRVETPSALQSQGGLDVEVSIIPGGPGVNTYDTVITQQMLQASDVLPAASVEEVMIQLVNPQRDLRSPWYEAESVDAGLYVSASADIDEPGEWWTLLDIVDASGELQRVAYPWQIEAGASILSGLEPSPLNLAALGSVLLALAWAGYPSAKRLREKLDLSPASLLVAAGATIIFIVLMVVAINQVEEQQRRIALTLNPLPERVNEVLPDEASLQRGQAHFEALCATWTGDPGFTQMLNQIDALRDETLFTASLNGWRNLPPCDADELSDAARWDLVNYIRRLGAPSASY